MPNGESEPGWRERFLEWLTAGVVIGAIATGTLLSESEAFDWGLHIVFFDVGQADAIAAVAPDGDAIVIDAGHGSTAADKIAEFLGDGAANGVGRITDLKFGIVTHYDLDHMGGFTAFDPTEVHFGRVYDQGPSQKRRGATTYEAYLRFVDDTTDNMEEDPGEEEFIRRRARVGLHWHLGEGRVRVLSARGDTRGSEHDLDLDPSETDLDENPGSVAVLITLGEFELYTAGDQTSDDWKDEPDTEIAVIASGVIGDDSDIDVFKANHHGSDTSNGRAFLQALRPEVAVISSKYTAGHRLPKLVAIQQLVESGARVYITGDGRGPDGEYAQSVVDEDDDFTVPPGTVVNQAGDVHILVRADGQRYRVFGGGEWRELSAVDPDIP